MPMPGHRSPETSPGPRRVALRRREVGGGLRPGKTLQSPLSTGTETHSEGTQSFSVLCGRPLSLRRRGTSPTQQQAGKREQEGRPREPTPQSRGKRAFWGLRPTRKASTQQTVQCAQNNTRWHSRQPTHQHDRHKHKYPTQHTNTHRHPTINTTNHHMTQTHPRTTGTSTQAHDTDIRLTHAHRRNRQSRRDATDQCN